MQEFLDQLQLPMQNSGEMTDDQYTVEFTDSNMFDRFYLTLARHDFLSLDEEASTLDVDSADLYWVDTDSKYLIHLEADYDSDKYKCTVEAL